MIKRKAIAQKFIDVLKTITTSGGYFLNVSANEVHHWRDRSFSNQETRYLIVKDETNSYEYGDGVAQRMLVRIELGCKVSDNYTTITNMLESVLRIIYNKHSEFENEFGFIEINPVEDNIEIQFEKSEKIGEGYVLFEVIHTVTSRWEPDTKDYT